MYNNEFGNHLAKLREAAGYKSQLQFANAVGISSSSISRVEANKQQIEPETLKKIAPFLNVSYEELMFKAGYLENTGLTSSSSSTHPKIERLQKIISAAEELPEEKINQVAELLELLIKQHQQSETSK